MSPSLNAKIAQVFDEPGCDINQGKSEKERKKGCTKQLTPGAAAGGCANTAVGIRSWAIGVGRLPNRVSATAWPSRIATGVSATRPVTSPTA